MNLKSWKLLGALATAGVGVVVNLATEWKYNVLAWAAVPGLVGLAVWLGLWLIRLDGVSCLAIEDSKFRWSCAGKNAMEMPAEQCQRRARGSQPSSSSVSPLRSIYLTSPASHSSSQP